MLVLAGLLLPLYAKTSQKIVHVYGWYGSIPTEVLKQFEAETGIQVTFDPVDSNEILEAKLLSGSSGYDVVFPTAWPFFARQIPAKLFQPIQKDRLSNYASLDPEILKKLRTIDPENTFGVPFTWGLVVLGINKSLMQKHVKDIEYSWGLVFNPETAGQLAGCGIALLDDVQDVYFNAGIFFNAKDLTHPETLQNIFERLQKVRPFIKKFDMNLSAEQLASGEICIAQQWADHLFQAIEKFKGTHSAASIEVILPKEGTTMWIDMIAIPKDAPHPDEAYAFINFLLRPEIAAAITNTHFTRTANKAAEPLIKPHIKKHVALFPPAAYLKKVHLPQAHDLGFQRLLTRAFTHFVSAQ